MSESNRVFKSKDDVVKALHIEADATLNVFEKDGNCYIKPREYLGTVTFNALLGKVRDIGGSYGNGLFTIPLKQPSSNPALSPYEELHRMVLDLNNYVQKQVAEILKKIGDLKGSCVK
jgi:hypothetical protein